LDKEWIKDRQIIDLDMEDKQKDDGWRILRE
jgi:hypothetical protein